MTCESCGQANPAGARFCNACGVALAQRCAGCGAENSAGARFCNQCGTAIAPGTPGPPSRSPREYTPKHLVEKILTQRSTLEGERKQVTVLFADVRGSLELAEALGAEEWHGILDRLFQILADGVHRFEGTVNQYTGDGIMALFGAPIAHEDHAQRACYAALHLRDELEPYGLELRRAHGLDFSVRMGLNSGEVVVGKIGDDLRMDYTAQGHVVGLAQRLEQLAEAGVPYLGETTAQIARGYFALEDRGEFQGKGAGAPLRAFALRGAGALRTRFDLSRARGLSRFVGRERELKTLEGALEQALAGQGQAVGVVAEAGTGKSRLCFELLERCRARGIRTGAAYCASHGKAAPLLPILELFREYFGVSERDAAQAAREKIAGRLLLLDRALDDCLPLLFDFLGVPDPGAPAPALEGEARQRQLFGILQRLVRARSAREPYVLVFEDLHWIDPASEAFLEKVVEFAAGTRTLVVANFRPEYRGGWLGRSHCQQIALLPLGEAEMGGLLAELLGPEASDAGLVERIRARTRGNPFFAEEVVHSLAESGALVGRKGRYRLAAPIERIEVPATVQSVLAARIDRLAEREKQVLQAAAVIGQEFRERVLRRVVDLADPELVAALARLVQAELLYEEALYPEAEYAFKHPLTQEVAYGAQLASSRARTHERVARALAEEAPERHDERAALLAHHFEAAGQVLEAAHWHMRAADWSGRRSLDESAQHLRRAIELAGGSTETSEAIRLGAEAHARLAVLSWRMAMPEEEVDRLRSEAVELARRSGDVRLRVFVTTTASYFHTWSGSTIRETLADLLEAVRLADELGDPELRVPARLVLADVQRAAGSREAALRTSSEGIELSEGRFDCGRALLGVSPGVFMLGGRAMELLARGQLAAARADLERVLHGLEESPDFLSESVALAWMAHWDERAGHAAQSLAHARRSLEKGGELYIATFFPYHALGGALLLAGEPRAAADALERSLEVIRRSPLAFHLGAGVQADLAWALAELGDPRARDVSEEAMRAARESDLEPVAVPLCRARVLRLLDGVAARGEIEAAIDGAERMAREVGHLGFLPFLHEERALLAGLLGDASARERELRQAQRLFAEMGATGHAERLARELA